MLYWLIFLLGILVIISYFIQNRDIMAPSVLLVIGYIIASICCLWNVDNWSVDIHQNTVVIIVLGVSCFIIGDFLALIANSNNSLQTTINEPTIITIPNITIILFSLFNILTLVLSIIDMLRITGGWLQTIGNTVGMFRNTYSYTDVMVNPWVVQLLKVSKASSYVFLYVFINNIFVGKREKISSFKKNFILLVPIVIYVLVTLSRGGRNNLITIAVAALFILYFLWHRQVGWKRSISTKFIKHIVLFFIVFVGLFFFTRTLVGRQSELPFVDYITTYFGGSIELFDRYLNSSITTKGNETFPGIFSSLYKLGLSDEVVHKSLEFRYSSSGEQLGNIYTGLRRFYNDFGYYGLITMQVFYGFLFGTIYSKIKRIKKLNSRRLFLVLFFATIIHAPLIQAMEDTFWINISVGYCIEIIIMYFCVIMIMDYRLASRGRIICRKWQN